MRSLRHFALWVFLAAGLLPLMACNFPLSPIGPEARPTVIVITSEGPYFATFDDPGGWLTGERDASHGRVADGAYLLALKRAGTLAWTHQQRAFGDGVYEVDAWLVSGPEASGFGLILVGTSDLSSFLYILITGDGRYDVGACAEACETQQSLIGGYQLAYSILPANEPNHLRAELRGGTLNLTINGAPVSAVQGLTYGEGLVGFIGESSRFGGFEAAFDNLQVTEFPPEATSTVAAPTSQPNITPAGEMP